MFTGEANMGKRIWGILDVWVMTTGGYGPPPTLTHRRARQSQHYLWVKL
jgi:hypothetical protein